MAGKRISIADFIIFSIYMSLVENEHTKNAALQAVLASKLSETPKV